MQAVESVEQGNYPLTFAVDLETTLKIEAEFSTAAFDAMTVERILDQLVVVLTAVAERPGLAVGDVPLQRPEQAAELVTWGRTPEPAAEQPVPELVDSWAHATPDTVAAVCGSDSLTFAQLGARADALAARLQQAGVTVESPVAVLVPRGVELAVAFLGVLRSGGVYVPINPGLPAERVAFLLADAGAVAVVTTSALAGELAGFDGEVVVLDDVTATGARPARPVSREALAYIAYTSGSTGRPKGVAVTHAALSSYVAGWRDGLRALGGPGTVLSMSGPGFDVSIGDMTRALAFGQRVVFLPHDEHVTVESLHKTLVDNEVEVAEIVPGMLLRDLAAYCRTAGPVESLRLVISGTDLWTHEALTAAVAEVAPNALAGNVFGVTEAAIDSIFHAVSDDHPAAVVPVGTPLAGAQAFVVDGSLRPVPVGVPGELLVGGAGVAQGYVGRPDLTAERFVPDVFSGSGRRLYRTGDRARWRADGTIEFLGRVDEQVKIRGYRVEPGEVEVVLGDHPDVRDVVVVARDGGPHGGKRLVAYVVGEFSAKVVRSWLRERVPDYLVPSVFVAIDRLPLTPNGKVDRRGLPDPEAEVGEAYVAPRTAVEEVLAAVWGDVLGAERVGVHDNFFELGGDSILSLQIVARVRAAGLGIGVADVFAHQTIAELALAAPDLPVVSVAEQGVVTGPVPLTPIQRWFLAQDLPNRDHWNWSGVFELAPGIDPDRLSLALDVVVAHHDALRIRFDLDGQYNAPVEGGGFLRVVETADVVAEMTAAQKSLRLADGPLLAAVFFDRGSEPAWLGLTVHHLVMDGVSWNVLLEDLDVVYHGGGLGPKTTSFQQWARQLQDDDASGEREHWAAVTADVVVLPADGDGPNTDASEAIVQSWLDAETTATLLGDAHRAYRTQGHDLLLTALARTLGEWAGTEHVTVDLESHGREGADLSRTVGWFTSIFPVRLSGHTDPGSAIKAVKEELRAVPRRGVGYGVLRWLRGEFAEAPDRPVLFNYLGAYDGVDSGGLIRGELDSELAGPSEGGGGTRSHLLQLEVQQTADGRLSIEWFHSTNVHDTATVERVAARYVEALRELVVHCRTARGFTPSDFPLASLTQHEIDRLAERYPLVDVYRLAPVQSGMLFGVVGSPVDGLYWGQSVYELAGPVDVERFAAAWRQVITRHASLRSGFVWEGVTEPVQVVLSDVDVQLEQRDWSQLDDGAQQVRLRELLDSDRALGFDLASPPLMRLFLVDRGEGRLWLVWGLYQGLCDGWSLPVVMDEVTAAYQGNALEPTRPYRDFIAWLDGRDPAEPEGFWREYLAGFEAPTALPVDRLAASHYDQDRRRTQLSEDVTAGLVELARRERVTLSTVVQAAWAKVLSASSAEDDIVFGLTVSGRPAELAGVESMVGLFINTLPIRAVVPADVPFTSWLHDLRDNQVAVQRFEYTPLVDVQRWSSVPHGRALFDSIVVFGNFPQEELPEDLGGVQAVESVEQGNYPLTFAVDLETTLKIEAEFSTAAFDAVTVERILDQLTVVLAAVAERPDLRVDDIPLQRPEQAARIVERGTTASPAAERPVPELIDGWARTSAGVAVICGDDRLSFAELGARADALAVRLRRAGVTAEAPVAVLVPRGVELAVAFQGVLRSGGGYVPINPGLPAERVAFLLADAGVVAAVATEALAGELAGFTGEVLLLDDSVVSGEVLAPADPNALAYIAYTSGSTGRPKGVAVTHAALSSYVAGWRDGLAALGGPGPVLSMSGPGFDVSIGDMTRALAFGQTVVFLPHDEHVSVESLHRTLSAHDVAIAEIVPGMLLRDLAAHCRTAGPVESLRLVISGTDLWTHDALTTAVAEVAPNALPGNVFGVTEAAIDSIFHEVTDDHPAAVVPIGTPLAGARAFVVDGSLRPVPVGVPGELLVGGAGVAQGYVGRPDLTAERFVPDVFGAAGSRLYRTGDRARWRADGTIEFLGRVDEQVKIRGYRVEPGEVEVVLGDHPDVRDVVVVARDGGPHGGKRLVAYVVGEFSAKVLRDWLRERVPDYLVPSVFVALERLPLTPNGKVDRRGLPDPAPETAVKTYVAPRTAVEETLAAVWSGVLGVERVGVHDNFFELGGDSILSLQIVARARAAGLGIDVADVFAHQTVAELAGAVRDTPPATLAEQGVVTGPVPLTPIQRWFLAQDIPDRDHWNWSGVFELAPGTDPDRLSLALDAVVAHHDALRIRLDANGQYHVPIKSGGFLRVAEGADVVAEMTAAQKSLRLNVGPLLAAVYFDRGDQPAWLGLTVHHLVMDGVSWNVLLEDLDTVYHGGELGPKTTSFQQWARQLQHDDASGEREHWVAATADVVALPADGDGPNTDASEAIVQEWLDAETTAALLGEAHQAYRTKGNDLLLAALAWALGEWAGSDHVTIDLESHGREGADLSRTVGWFTSIFPVRLTSRRDPAAAVKAVKEELRAVPRRGVGYGVLRWLRGELAGVPDRPVLFNYLGAHDGADSGGLIRRELNADLAGPSEGEGGTRSHLVQIEVQQTDDGRLSIEWFHSTNVHDTATVQRVAKRYVEALRELVVHCRTAGGFTPSDFPLASLSQDEVDGLAERYPLVDVYRLAPVQSGMLFGVVGSPVDGLYWGQGVYELAGPIDAGRLAGAWRQVINRHPALRSGFVWEGVSEPVQIVPADVEMPLTTHDWSDLDEAAQQLRLQELLADDRALGFDLARPPLTRVHLVDRGNGRNWLVWGLYQGLCDGWSLPVVMDEVSVAYQGQPLPHARPYRDYISWLGRRDPADTEGFWRMYLDGFEAPTALPVDRLAASHHDQDRRRTHLDEDVTTRLVELARRERVTLSTVVQAAWAKVLSASSGEDDVVFGLTVSGRPADLAGVESMVGLFINTLPVRAVIPGRTSFAAWLHELRDNQVALQRFEFTPLVDVQRWSAVPHGRGLFDSIVVFGNYPQEEAPGDAGEEWADAVESVEQGNYPLTFAVDLEATLKIEAEFSTAAFDATTVERVLDQLVVVLTAVAHEPELAVADLPLQRPEQAARLVEQGETPAPAAELPVPELIHGWAHTDAIAARCGDERLTFAELDARSAGLAARLRHAGVTVESPVAVLVPRGIDLAIAFQGVLRSGGVYVPINPGLPAERLAFLLADAGAVAAVTTVELARELAGFTGEVLVLDDTVRDDLPVRVDPNSLAYIAYTSGSTGRPKGVAVTHGALSSYVAGWRAGLADVGGPGAVLSMSGPGFDVSIGDMTRALAFGQSVVFLPHDEHVSVESLHSALSGDGVAIAEIVPGMLLRDLAAHCRTAGPVESLRLVISGTDLWTHDALTTAVAEVAPNAVPGNVFGVTEAAIDSILHKVADDHPQAVVPIGTPLAGARAVIVDDAMRPAPVGVAGELLVGGPGVARGYVHRPDLTAERFVPDVFGASGGRLYRTGDRARWRADGTIEFLGRVDEQVKIRGHRVEPGEVEVVIGDHPDVREVVVVAADGGPHGGKRLVAYVVGEFSAKDLRSWLRERVPDHLVPSVFVALERLPLTPNGKVDRRNLPDPEPGTAEVFEAPRTSVEDTLAAVWSQVLGLERVGVHDNFFELGGDSILSLQIVARARAAGLGVDVADVFAHQTIAELAPVVRDTPTAVLAEQGVVTGPVPLTPIQHWFVEQDVPGRDHWNWSGVFELAQGTDPARLARALDAVVAHHDALRIRFRQDGDTWVQDNDGERTPALRVLTAQDDDEVVARMTEAQMSLRLADGPLLAALYFDRGTAPAWLGLTAHHLVMDGVAWNVLLEDLDTAYRAGPEALGPKTTSFRQWAEVLHNDDPDAERDHWAAQVERVTALPVDGHGANTEASADTVRTWLDAKSTEVLLGEAHQAYRTQINDLLLAALLRTLGEWAGSGDVTIDLESHGREAIGDGVDLSRTVGWFTSIFPVRLRHDRLDDSGELIKAVKEQLRAVPRRGVGYGILRYLVRDARLVDAPERPVLFNYLGAFDAVGDDAVGLIRRELSADLCGPTENEQGTRSHLLQIEAEQTSDGRLLVEWYFGIGVHRRTTVERLATRYVDVLRELVEHCQSGARGVTPSDFPLAGVDQAGLAAVLRQMGG
ncbi:non-ribosomal peptide synthetase [Lentzea aerocolonigenes]|uniref:non-ribosomal peptide synthetase n=1 Tax=Lentzea aerocolonigenes TaxID=68170 RepID=UPI0020A4CEF6|nr:non-ribosomal peptide synthetase [Lentzea aerocolonigenes]